MLWRVIAAWALLNDSCPASEVNRLLLPALEAVTPPRNAESLVSTTAKFLLIANGELDTARRLCDGLVEVARPQGWLIALAHGSFMRAIALLRLGRIHEAHADAQLSFDFKQGNSPPAALVWSLFPLVEALTEMNELDAAEAALDAGHRLGDPPPACVSSTLLLERRAHLRLAQRRYDEAHADLLLAADWWRRLRVQHPGVASWRVDDCEALVALGDSGSARRSGAGAARAGRTHRPARTSRSRTAGARSHCRARGRRGAAGAGRGSARPESGATGAHQGPGRSRFRAAPDQPARGRPRPATAGA